MKARFLHYRGRFLQFASWCENHSEMAERDDVARQLKNFVSSLKSQGTLDECYDALVNLKDDNYPQFLLETITLFIKESDLTIYEIQRATKNYPIEYSKVVSSAHKLKGCSASVGGSRMASACRELRQASEYENMERSIDAFNKVKCEYEVLRESLGLIGRMEQRIKAMKGGRA